MLQARHRAVAVVRNRSHHPTYVWLVVWLVSLSTPLGGLVIGGPLGDFLTFVGFCGMVGTAIATQFALRAERRARRAAERFPWSEKRSVEWDRYVGRGVCIGLAVGLALGAIDSYLL